MMRRAAATMIVAAALVAPIAAWAQASEQLVGTVPSITVTGEAQREVASDLALVTIGVVTDRPTPAQAAQDNAQAATALVSTAKAAGLTALDIQTSDLRLSALMDDKDAGKIRAYRASNTVVLRLRDLARIGGLVGQLTAKGANALEGVAFSVADPQPVLDELQVEAMRKAMRKAEVYAEAAGVKLGRVLRILPVGDAAPMTMRAFKMQAAPAPASPPVEGGSQTLRAGVEVSWELAP